MIIFNDLSARSFVPLPPFIFLDRVDDTNEAIPFKIPSFPDVLTHAMSCRYVESTPMIRSVWLYENPSVDL